LLLERFAQGEGRRVRTRRDEAETAFKKWNALAIADVRQCVAIPSAGQTEIPKISRVRALLGARWEKGRGLNFHAERFK